MEYLALFILLNIVKKISCSAKISFTYLNYVLLPIHIAFINDSDAALIFHRFIEYGEYKNNYYGTSIDSIRSVLAKNKVCLLDVQPHVSKQWTVQDPSGLCNLGFIYPKSHYRVNLKSTYLGNICGFAKMTKAFQYNLRSFWWGKSPYDY